MVYVVGGHGYIGSRIVAEYADAQVVSRTGDTRHGRDSIGWERMLERLPDESGASVILTLDHRHGELAMLEELLAAAPTSVHVVICSSCTVYGDRGDGFCDEATSLDLVTANARAKWHAELLLARSQHSWAALRLGALYGIDSRQVRADRVQKYVQQAKAGVVTVPDRSHWRGWLHADQAARALWRAAVDRAEGVYCVAAENHTWGQAAGFAAEWFGAEVVDAEEPDPCSNRIDATLARADGLLDERPGEALAETIRAYAETVRV